jgi:RNA recognition motif-containing protein
MPEEEAKTEEKPQETQDDKKKPKDGGKTKGKGKGKGKGGKGKTWENFSGPTGSGTGYRLNVKNLTKEHDTKEKLTALFAPFGTVSEADIKLKEDGTSKGFGYVILKDKDEADKAIKELNDKEFGGKKLNVAPAERRATDDMAMGGMAMMGKGKGKGMPDAFGWGSAQQMQAAQAAWMAQFFAMQQMYAGGYPQAPWGVADQGATKEYEGSLKSISAKNGYGFIVCAETHAIYGRDVYIEKDLLPEGANPKDRIRFTVALNNKNHPKAVTASKV